MDSPAGGDSLDCAGICDLCVYVYVHCGFSFNFPVKAMNGVERGKERRLLPELRGRARISSPRGPETRKKPRRNRTVPILRTSNDKTASQTASQTRVRARELASSPSSSYSNIHNVLRKEARIWTLGYAWTGLDRSRMLCNGYVWGARGREILCLMTDLTGWIAVGGGSVWLAPR